MSNTWFTAFNFEIIVYICVPGIPTSIKNFLD